MGIEIISVGESRIEVNVQGVGTPVVLIPGMGVDVSMFDDLVSKLNKAGFQTIAINARGVGGSAGPLEGLTLHDFASDVAGVIRILNIAPAHILGAATGNRLARCVAADFPDLIKSVVLLGAGGLLEPDPEAAGALRRMLQPGLSQEQRLDCARVALYSPASDIEKLGLPKEPWPVVLQHAQIYLTTPVKEWWDAGRAPMLVIQGLDDRLALPGNGRQLADEHGDRVELVELEEAGHLLLVEKPNAIAETVISYLSKVRGLNGTA